MRLPFVSRAHHEELVAELRERLNAQADYFYGHVLPQESARFAEVFEKYHAIKIAGGVVPEPVVQREKKEPDALTQAVLNASIGKPVVRAAMLKQLAEDRKSLDLGLMTEMDIQRRIEQGFTPDDGIPE